MRFGAILTVLILTVSVGITKGFSLHKFPSGSIRRQSGQLNRIYQNTKFITRCGVVSFQEEQCSKLPPPNPAVVTLDPVHESAVSMMSVKSNFTVTNKEQTKSKEKVNVVLDESDIEEKFVRCTGNGGQKVNKSSSKAELTHKPTGIKVSCQDFRDLSSNRARARKLLLAKLDLHFNGKLSKIGQKQDLVRKRKKNAARKAKKKYGHDKTEVASISVAQQD